ncbi:MAG: hypothetical protein L0Y54_13050 [Sporichthyaceae bacterium]|nr:hypothetical protein [Sporichthyaceae bacterium]
MANSRERDLELRVHGVLGSSPENTLNYPHVQLVAGGKLVGFYRKAYPEETIPPLGPPVEAYSWGNLTVGAAARAFWLLLLPFTLVNTAFWMRPREVTKTGPGSTGIGIRFLSRVWDASARLLALSLTAMLVLGAAGVGMDLLGWQCAGEGRTCGATRSWLRPFTAEGAFWEQPGRRLTVAVLVPLAVLAVLAYLAHKTWVRYEAQQPPKPDEPPQSPRPPLADPGFWRGEQPLRRAGMAHITIGVAAVTTLLTWPTYNFDRSVRDTGGMYLGRFVLTLAAAAAVGAAILVVFPRFLTRARSALTDDLAIIPPSVAGIALVLGVWHAMQDRPGWVSSGRLPGLGGLLTALIAVQVAIVLVFIVTTLVLRQTAPTTGKRAAFRGLAAPVIATLGWYLGAAFTAGVSFQAADWLDSQATPTAAAPAPEIAGRSDAEPPEIYAWGAFGFTVEVAVLVLVALGVLLLAWTRLRRARAAVRREYGEALADAHPRRTRAIALARTLGTLVDDAPWFLFALVAPATVLAAITAWSVLTHHGRPLDWIGSGESDWRSLVDSATTTGVFLISVFVLALVAVGRYAYGDGRIRRLVGVLWDIGTFWPRSAHPLAPPCYAERVVPDLMHRIQGWDPNGAGTILSGHSQGSVIAAATVFQLSDDEVSKVTLLTYGSPLRRLYARYFPAYFGEDQLQLLADRVDWLNLWRRTDSIGSDVDLGVVGVDIELTDPAGFDRRPGDPDYPRINAHSDYHSDAGYAAALDLIRRSPAPPRTDRS